MRIYTRTGDGGETGLLGGERVPKDDLRVEAYGTLDEAMAALGLAAAHLSADSALRQQIEALQGELFVVGADLATPLSATKNAVRIAPERASALEAQIDAAEAELSPLASFILPGGCPAAAALHLARTLVRRAERRVATLLRAEPERTSAEPLRYLNRASDLLFVLARLANARAGVADIPWRRPKET